ncbi:transporter substrate-binding domain-containing protein [Vibrio profundum]|uniref:substrate-binding periplasmic protein n=1 Tax=Vibrio profundum TaxID=2910247 RepID=UPI003D0A1CD3
MTFCKHLDQNCRGNRAWRNKVMRAGLFIALITVNAYNLNAEELKISTPSFAPAGFIDEDGKLKGMLYEVANEIMENANINYINVLKPYPRILLELKNGSTDISILYSNKQLEGNVNKIVVVYTDSNVIVGKPSLVIRSLSDLHGRKVATVRNASYSTEFDSDSNIIKVNVKNYRQSVLMLLKGRVDALIGGSVAIYHELSNMGYDWQVLGSPYVVSTKPVWLLLSAKNDNQQLVGKLRRSVRELNQRGVIQNLIIKYSGRNHLVTFE